MTIQAQKKAPASADASLFADGFCIVAHVVDQKQNPRQGQCRSEARVEKGDKAVGHEIQYANGDAESHHTRHNQEGFFIEEIPRPLVLLFVAVNAEHVLFHQRMKDFRPKQDKYDGGQAQI